MTEFARLRRRLGKHGLTIIGAFEPDPGEIGEARSVVLVGNAGSAMWRRLDPRPSDPSCHGIDIWTRKVLEPIASDCGASVVFPFEGPPYHPFVSWAFQTGRCFKSRLAWRSTTPTASGSPFAVRCCSRMNWIYPLFGRSRHVKVAATSHACLPVPWMLSLEVATIT